MITRSTSETASCAEVVTPGSDRPAKLYERTPGVITPSGAPTRSSKSIMAAALIHDWHTLLLPSPMNAGAGVLDIAPVLDKGLEIAPVADTDESPRRVH